MDFLSDYLKNEYLEEKEQLRSVNDIIKQVIPIYGKFDDVKGWDYKVDNCDKSDTRDPSTSTLAMIAFSMKVLKEGSTDLNSNNVCSEMKSHYESLKDEDKDKFDNILIKSKKIIESVYNKNGKKFSSGTYGENDPFTRVWIQNLKSNIENSNLNIEDLNQEKYVEEIFEKIHCDKSKLKYSEGTENKIESTHVFPLLKVVQLYEHLKNSTSLNIKSEHIESVKSEMLSTLYKHLSLAEIENSNFDTAELVFALEGVLLLDGNRENFDKNLVIKVFSVIKERQAISMYWRPLKPFVMKDNGLALLPLSVEIAMSLIRICRLLNKFGDSLFTQYFEVFNSYTEWLKTRMNVVECGSAPCPCSTDSNCFSFSKKRRKFYGWCSEHIQQPDVIHLWETSQVIIYLANFNDMLQKHIAIKTLKCANFSIKHFEPKGTSWKEWMEGEPLKKGNFEIYKKINEKFILSEDYRSMLLYGPPGTGKSSIAEEIAKAKKWPLLTITPSDFIANGADLVESKAKNIFKVLEEQSEMVVLFDEIDRLILDRDSKEYSKQSDIFQFMTPSMLVKIKDLRTKKRIIFIIATNYEERIDMAIKRTGRIDEKYLVLPLSKEQRERNLKKHVEYDIKKKKHKNNQEDDTLKLERIVSLLNKYDIIDQTALFTYTEFEQYVKTLIYEINQNPAYKPEQTPKASISIIACSRKILDEEWCQKPYKEFFAILYLIAETRAFSEEETTEIKKVFLKKFNIKISKNIFVDRKKHLVTTIQEYGQVEMDIANTIVEKIYID